MSPEFLLYVTGGNPWKVEVENNCFRLLATLGNQLGVLSLEATNTLVGTSIVSITLNPLPLRATGPIDRWVSARTSRALDAAATTEPPDGRRL